MRVNNKYNKATISAFVGALLTVVASVWPDLLRADTLAALQTVIVTAVIFFIPNKEA